MRHRKQKIQRLNRKFAGDKEIKDFYFYQGILGVYTGLADLMYIQGKFEVRSLGYDHGFGSGYCKMLEYNTLFFACQE